MFLFFFQAEDGIRDYKVTGVQTCALPICKARVIISRLANRTEVGIQPVERFADQIGPCDVVPRVVHHGRFCASGVPRRRNIGICEPSSGKKKSKRPLGIRTGTFTRGAKLIVATRRSLGRIIQRFLGFRRSAMSTTRLRRPIPWRSCRMVLAAAALAAVVATQAVSSTGPAGASPVEWANDLSPIAATDWSYDRAAHLLERAGFGGTPEEIGRLTAMTPRQAVDSLVDFES